jgi:hypothetical protein
LAVFLTFSLASLIALLRYEFRSLFLTTDQPHEGQKENAPSQGIGLRCVPEARQNAVLVVFVVFEGRLLYRILDGVDECRDLSAVIIIIFVPLGQSIVR